MATVPLRMARKPASCFIRAIVQPFLNTESVVPSLCAVEAVSALAGAREAGPSMIGIALATASLVVMPVLSLAQRRRPRSAVADPVAALGIAAVAVREGFTPGAEMHVGRFVPGAGLSR
jgi:hypothetical protein